jgi:Flp pilus assembly protein TadG
MMMTMMVMVVMMMVMLMMMMVMIMVMVMLNVMGVVDDQARLHKESPSVSEMDMNRHDTIFLLPLLISVALR